MTRFGKLVLMGVLAGTLGLVGCSSDGGGSGGGTGGTPGTGGNPGTGGSAGAGGGAGGTGGTGGTPSVDACGAGEAIDGSYGTSVGLVECNALDVITVPIEVVIAAKTAGTPNGDTPVDVRVSLNLDEETVGNLGGLVREALIGEASADVGDSPLTAGVNVAATAPCTIDFTQDPDNNGTAGPVEVVTPMVLQDWPAVGGAVTVEGLDITFAISQPVPLTLTTKGADARCTWIEVPSVTLN